MTSISVKFNNFGAKINDKIIFEKINFNAKQNDIVCLIGPNGAGKTTFLKSIMKHFNIQNIGDVLINNNSTNNMQTCDIAKLGVSYIQQFPTEINGLNSLTLIKTLYKKDNITTISQIIEKLDNKIKKFSLPENILQRDVNVDFSGGQKKKFELLLSSISNSNIFLLDEIDSGLDIDALNFFIKYISSIRKKSIIFLVSHNIDFINKLNPSYLLLFNDNTAKLINNFSILKKIEKNGFDIESNSNNRKDFSCLVKKIK